jgi:ring-1,2-phenylacetyl-CoA epoxidase subunit PaaE
MSSKHFHTIKIKDIQKTTDDCAIISLDIPDELKEEFHFKQGQYLNLEAIIDGEEVRRSYSLCSSPLDNEWKVGIKKIEGGKFSTFANDRLKIGDSIKVMSAHGHFYVDTNQELNRNYMAFAAGSGITPIVSIIKTHLASEPKSSFKLFYTNKNVASIILKEELESLKNLYMDRFEIFYFLTKEKRNIPFLNGRLDREKLDTIFTNIQAVDTVDHFFSCGPEKMTILINDYLKEKGIDKHKIHFELFNTSGIPSEQKEALKKKMEGKVSRIEIIEGGKTLNFLMNQGANNLLDEALNNNADLPFACKGGMCATCKAKLIKGKVEMLLSYGLEDDEKEEGYILTCQSIPISEEIIVDYDI